MIHGAGEVGVGERDAAEWGGAENFARRRLAVRTEEKAGLRAEVRMAPAIQNDAGDVALRVEACAGKHLRELFTNAPFVFVERSGEQFGATALALRFGAEAGIRKQNLYGEHRR